MATPLGGPVRIFRLLTISSKPECLSSVPGQRPFLVGRPAVRSETRRYAPRNLLAEPRASKRTGHAHNDGDAWPGSLITAGVWSGESLVHLEQVALVWLYSGPPEPYPGVPLQARVRNGVRLH